jgi:hypothetical protein
MTVSIISRSTACRVVAAVGCGFALAACSMSMPSFDFSKSDPTTEVLRIESKPPGADARTSQGQTCRTPCELTVPSDNELAVTVQMTGFQAQTLPVRADGKGGLQPNPVYVELLPAAPPPKPAKPAPVAKKKPAAAAAPPAPRAPTQAAAPPPSTSAYPMLSQGYPWPPAPQ